MKKARILSVIMAFAMAASCVVLPERAKGYEPMTPEEKAEAEAYAAMLAEEEARAQAEAEAKAAAEAEAKARAEAEARAKAEAEARAAAEAEERARAEAEAQAAAEAEAKQESEQEPETETEEQSEAAPETETEAPAEQTADTEDGEEAEQTEETEEIEISEEVPEADANPEGEVTEEALNTEEEEIVVYDTPLGDKAFLYEYEKDANGNLILDAKGNPIVILKNGQDIPVAWLRNSAGELILDGNGNPVATQVIPASAVKIQTLRDKLNPNRTIDIYATFDQKRATLGAFARLTAVLYGYDDLIYSLQWQQSRDGKDWTDVPSAYQPELVVETSEENQYNYWRVKVTIIGTEK